MKNSIKLSVLLLYCIISLPLGAENTNDELNRVASLMNTLSDFSRVFPRCRLIPTTAARYTGIHRLRPTKTVPQRYGFIITAVAGISASAPKL